MAQINFEALRLAAAMAFDVYMEFSAPYGTYIKRSHEKKDEECDICLKRALKALRKLEKAAGVTIVEEDITWLEMADVCTEIDREVSRLAMARAK